MCSTSHGVKNYLNIMAPEPTLLNHKPMAKIDIEWQVPVHLPFQTVRAALPAKLALPRLKLAIRHECCTAASTTLQLSSRIFPVWGHFLSDVLRRGASNDMTFLLCDMSLTQQRLLPAMSSTAFPRKAQASCSRRCQLQIDSSHRACGSKAF
eukprot:TRINITY_DN80988_c0_g1_i1.p1 TRINITY_DN80988_c0_g1~~TRINITY_DN80988_c0_g1_i1.p1  ORF type:complete len:152 (-),score=18.17 TRINITY_DN80988_c0_g1_i1:83-538(-)